MAKSRVLVVEDDQSLGDVLAYNIRQAGYDVHVARDGRDALQQAERFQPDLIVLDLMLPLMDGLEVCRRLRSRPATQDTFILMLTAKSEESDQLVGFSMGADDYVTKPFSVKVLLERMKALFRRRDAETEDRHVSVSQGVILDRERHQVTVRDQKLDLTPSEFRLLDTLIRKPGRAYSRDELIDAALGEGTVVLERTIDVHIRSLRRKLGEYAQLVETVRGVGYRFRDPTPSATGSQQRPERPRHIAMTV